MDRAKVIKYSLIAAAGIGAGIGIYFIIKATRRKRTKDAVDTLIDLFQKESELTQSQIDRLRFVFDIENYQLPPNIQKALDDNRELIKKAVDYFKAKDVNRYFNTIATIKSRLSPAVLPDFEFALNMAYDVVRKFERFDMDGNTLFSRLRNFVTPSREMIQLVGTYAWVVSPLALVLAPRYVQYSENVKNNPEYTIIKDLYANPNLSKNRLKLFDEIWKIYSGKPFFVSEIKNVKA
jgi:hypothetical protein